MKPVSKRAGHDNPQNPGPCRYAQSAEANAPRQNLTPT